MKEAGEMILQLKNQITQATKLRSSEAKSVARLESRMRLLEKENLCLVEKHEKLMQQHSKSKKKLDLNKNDFFRNQEIKIRTLINALNQACVYGHWFCTDGMLASMKKQV